MIAQLKKRFGGNDLFTVQKGESENLGLGDDGFEYAFANMFLHHVKSPQNTIWEMARILKPGGKLIITDLDTHRFEFLVREHHDRWMGFRRSDVYTWFAAAGLINVTVTCATKVVPPTPQIPLTAPQFQYLLLQEKKDEIKPRTTKTLRRIL